MKRLDDTVRVSGQIRPEELAALTAEGVTMIVNNRPDGEAPGQPSRALLNSRTPALSISCKEIASPWTVAAIAFAGAVGLVPFAGSV